MPGSSDIKPLAGRLETDVEVEKFRALVELSSDFIAIARVDGSVEYVNRAGRELIGLPSLEEARAKTIRDMLTEAGWERSVGIEQPAVLRDGFWQGESTLRHQATNEEIEVSINSFLLTHPLTGEPIGLATVQHDIRELKRAQEQLRYVAEHDPLTGLKNRRRFEEALRQNVRLDNPQGGSVVLIDLDNFKIINDSLGHAAGDEVLKAVAATLADASPADASLARLGGDEFALHLPGVDQARASAVAEDMLCRIRRSASYLHVTASAGMAEYPAHSTLAPHDVFVAADVALYHAKEAGRDRLLAYRGGKGAGLTWVDRIRDAFEHDRLRLYAQPIYDLRPFKLRGYELLVRMLDPAGEAILPASFLPTAERFGLVGQIDAWVVQTALQTARGIGRVSINLSARSFGDLAFADRIAGWMDEFGVDPGTLVFEVTETSAFSNLNTAARFTDRLRARGCAFALDDFGTGFGALTSLKAIEIDILKIDQEFTSDLTTSERSRRIVASVVESARAFGADLTAEGVEDQATLDALDGLGVGSAQGYFLGRPAPLENLTS